MSSSPSSWSSISTPQSDASPQLTDTIQPTNTEMVQSPNSGYTLKQRKAGKTSNEIERKENGRRGEETKTSSSSEGQIKKETPCESPTVRHRNSDADAELHKLRSDLNEMVVERQLQDEILTGLVEEDWNHLIRRSMKIRDHFNNEMDALISDVQAMCDHAQQQKTLTSGRFHTNGERLTPIQGIASPEVGDRHAPSKHEKKGVAATRRGLGIQCKEFTWRDSVLTIMFRTQPNVKTVYNMWVAVLILFALKIFIRDLFVLNESPDDVSLWMFLRTFGKLGQVIPAWFAMAFIHGMMLPIMWAWRLKYLDKVTYSLIYLLHQICFLLGFGYMIKQMDLPVASSLILLNEQIRMIMKSHSFWRETIRLKDASQVTISKDIPAHLSSSQVNSTFLPTFIAQARQFVLFHFVPTLIYRNWYPRTRSIRWKFVATKFAEVCGCIFYIYVIFANLGEEFHKTASSPGTTKELIVSLFNSALPGIGVYLLTFFGLLHCWMNMFAEMTRFADRVFYQDWWHTTSFSSYYRKWNMIVHDSLYNYVYVDLYRLGVPQGICFFLTFLVSAVVHEYIITMSLKFFYPVLFIMFLVFGVAFIYLTRLIGSGSHGWNTFFWANLIIGSGGLLILYSRGESKKNVEGNPNQDRHWFV